MRWLALLVLSLSCTRTAPHIGGVAHMALYVRDLAKSRAFYRDFLGFAEPYSLPRPDGSDRIAFIKINDQQVLELFAEPLRNGVPLNHISFYTDDARGLRNRLAARGVKVPATVGKGRIGNSNYNINDPDGNQVEIVQYEPAGWTVRDRGKFMPPTRIAPRIGHLGVVVAALDPALKFYRDTLGFQEIWRGGRSQQRLSWVDLRVPDGDDYLELMLDPAPTVEERRILDHLCLVTPDVVRAVAELERRPARKSYPGQLEIEIGANHRRQANLFDPDGTRIELMEDHTMNGQPVPSSKAPPPR